MAYVPCFIFRVGGSWVGLDRKVDSIFMSSVKCGKKKQRKSYIRRSFFHRKYDKNFLSQFPRAWGTLCR
jgi:hypothetical protein